MLLQVLRWSWDLFHKIQFVSPLKELAPTMLLRKRLHRQNVFDENGRKNSRLSVFQILGPLKKGNTNYRRSRFSKPRFVQNMRSLISSHMKRQTTLTISRGKELKAKMRTVILTRTIDDEDDRESVASSYHTVSVARDSTLCIVQSSAHQRVAHLIRNVSLMKQMA